MSKMLIRYLIQLFTTPYRFFSQSSAGFDSKATRAERSIPLQHRTVSRTTTSSAGSRLFRDRARRQSVLCSLPTKKDPILLTTHRAGNNQVNALGKHDDKPSLTLTQVRSSSKCPSTRSLDSQLPDTGREQQRFLIRQKSGQPTVLAPELEAEPTPPQPEVRQHREVQTEPPRGPGFMTRTPRFVSERRISVDALYVLPDLKQTRRISLAFDHMQGRDSQTFPSRNIIGMCPVVARCV
jgi:hypothetical protein